MSTKFILKLLDDTCLSVREVGDPKPIQVRGQSGYATNHQPWDPLHHFLDGCDAATVSSLMTYEEVVTNINNPRSVPTYLACYDLFEKND